MKSWKTMRTSIERHLRNPLIFKLLILPILAPPVNPLLPFLVPLFLVPSLFLDTLRCSKLLPFSGWFGLRQRLGTG